MLIGISLDHPRSPHRAVARPAPSDTPGGRTASRHAQTAEGAYKRLVEVHASLVEIQPLPGFTRLVPDDVATEAYECGSSMVSNVVRTIRHFALDIAGAVQREPEEGRAIDELRSAADMIGLDVRVRSAGYQALAEIVRVRDAIEHPKLGNVHQGGDADWDRVPPAWILSDRSRECYDAYEVWFEPIVKDWHAWLEAQPRVTQTLTVQRGVGSAYPMKRRRSSLTRADSSPSWHCYSDSQVDS